MSDFNLFIYKIFSLSDLIQFQLYLIFEKKMLFTLIVSKEFITKFQFGYKNYFYLLLLEKKNEFLQFYFKKKYFNLFI